MDFTSLYYFKELSKTLNMTQTAKKLYISQQTLSNYIIRLERECGNELFYRKPSLKLTNAGSIMLDFAVKMLNEQSNMQNILNDIHEQKTGVIKFGASTLRMNACLPNIIPSFNSIYPGVKIELFDNSSKYLEDLLEDGDLDMAIVASNKHNDNIIIRPLMEDQVFVCVSNKLLVDYYGKDILNKRDEFINGVCIEEFKKLPFLIFNNRLGRQIHNCFVEAKFEPDIYMTGSYVQIVTSIGFTGVAAFFNSRLSLSLRRSDIPADMNIFPLLLSGEPVCQQIYLISNKNRFMTKYMLTFSNMLVDYFANEEQKVVKKIAEV